MSYASLEDKIKEHKTVVEMLRNAPVGPYVFPIQGEYSNWRDEQEGWRKSAVLFDQSFHMTDSHFRGLDVYRLLEYVSVNSYKNFHVNQAKQIVCCNEDGYVIGDSILFHHAENHVSIVGRPPISNWVAFNAKAGGYDVEVVLDERSASNPNQRVNYRLQIQGPTAAAILRNSTVAQCPILSFLKWVKLSSALIRRWLSTTACPVRLVWSFGGRWRSAKL